MQCPIDGETLVMTARSGVEIDYCPKCRGVWLDRGELDKIVERAEVPAQPAAAAAQPQYDPRRDTRHRDDGYHDERRRDDHDRRRDDYDPRYHGKPYKKKRESFLGELFDF